VLGPNVTIDWILSQGSNKALEFLRGSSIDRGRPTGRRPRSSPGNAVFPSFCQNLGRPLVSGLSCDLGRRSRGNLLSLSWCDNADKDFIIRMLLASAGAVPLTVESRIGFRHGHLDSGNVSAGPRIRLKDLVVEADQRDLRAIRQRN
jgi:hypothetical protein